MRLFNCPLCGQALDVRLDKKKKYYVICDDCGVQMFVRGQPGKLRFEELIEEQAETRQRSDALPSKVAKDRLFKD